MKKNDSVMIYEDPITKTNPVGYAILLQQLPERNTDSPGLELWEVELVDDDIITQRWIYNNKNKIVPFSTLG